MKAHSNSTELFWRAGFCFAALIIALLAGSALNAQVVTASLRGTVVDVSGSIIPNAAVKAVNSSTNVVTQTKTDENGRFVFRVA